MAPPPLPKRLSAMEVVEKCAGPKVDIYIGPESKHYKLPKDILCHYSKFFDRCFNGNFKEAKEQKLNLPEDKPEWFELLLDWIFSGGQSQFKPNSDDGSELDSCMEFVQYAEKYDIPAAATIVTDIVTRILVLDREKKHQLQSLKKYIPLIFRVFPVGHELRAQFARYFLKDCYTSSNHEEEEATVDGFAAEVLKQARMFKYKPEGGYITDPFTGKRLRTSSESTY